MPTHDKNHDNAQTNEPPHPHYDPRLGDEESEETRTEQPQRHVRIQVPTWTSHPVHDEKVHQFREKRRAFSEQLRSVGTFVVKNFPLDLQWIPNNWTWSKWKPVIRSAILGWLSILFMVITRLEEITGQVRLASCALRSPWPSHHRLRECVRACPYISMRWQLIVLPTGNVPYPNMWVSLNRRPGYPIDLASQLPSLTLPVIHSSQSSNVNLFSLRSSQSLGRMCHRFPLMIDADAMH